MYKKINTPYFYFLGKRHTHSVRKKKKKKKGVKMVKKEYMSSKRIAMENISKFLEFKQVVPIKEVLVYGWEIYKLTPTQTERVLDELHKINYIMFDGDKTTVTWLIINDKPKPKNIHNDTDGTLDFIDGLKDNIK